MVGGAVAALGLGAVPAAQFWLAVTVGVLVAAASIAAWLRHAAGILRSAAMHDASRLPSPPTGAADWWPDDLDDGRDRHDVVVGDVSRRPIDRILKCDAAR